MQDLLHHPLTVFMGFFAIMNPVANVPIFLGLTSDLERRTTKVMAFRSVTIAFFIVLVFSIAGKIIFEVFSISHPALRITGGVLVALIGFHMLQGNQSSVHHPDAEDMQKCQEGALGIAVSPLAIPILAGPGTIATAMNFSSQGGIAGVLTTVVSFGVLCAITYMFFIFGERFVKFIGVGLLGVITRLMGLILAVIGVQMLIEGLHSAFRLG